MGFKILIAFVLADFTMLTVYALNQFGLIGLFDAVFANAATITAFADLVIALSLAMIWMWQDARKRGVSALPYCAVTLVAGSVGPLLYLLLRPSERPA